MFLCESQTYPPSPPFSFVMVSDQAFKDNRMVINKQNVRLIFGLKLKQLRIQKGLSFAQLSKAAGVSVSYLNEIEKGKKYPKTDKILALAQALGVSYDQLVSLRLSKKLAPIADLLNSGMLNSLPLEMFGLEPSTLIELISNAPVKINAFISTILKISRNYEMSQEHFFFAALRSFQEMNDNYFEGLEKAVEVFTAKYNLDTRPPIDKQALLDILIHNFGYQINWDTLHADPDLQHFRSVYVAKHQQLFINNQLSQMQQAFLLGKEIAYNFLEITERPTTSSLFEVKSFEEVLNNFRASYFAVALLVNRHELIQDLQAFFALPSWEPQRFLDMMNKYGASPEMFIHRVTNLLPTFFDLDNFFFLRFNHYLDRPEDPFHMTKELHISRLHNPHRNDLNEHYCRRWVSLRILQQLNAHPGKVGPEEVLIDAQVSRYIGTKSEYFCISLARPNTPSPQSNVSVTLGFFLDNNTRKKIQFVNHPDIPVRDVNETCERCPLTDCEERVADPHVIQLRNRQQQIKARLRDLSRPSKAVDKST